MRAMRILEMASGRMGAANINVDGIGGAYGEDGAKGVGALSGPVLTATTSSASSTPGCRGPPPT